MAEYGTEQLMACFDLQSGTCFPEIGASYQVIALDPLAEEGLFRKALEQMPEYCIRKIEALQRPEARCETLGAWFLLAAELEKRGYLLRERQIRERENGKPFLADLPLEFNLSHAGGYAACVTAEAPVGIDLEMCSRMERFLLPDRWNTGKTIHFWERICTLPERALLEAMGLGKPGETTQISPEFLTRLWTRKEACAKACGKGLAMDFREIDTMEEDRYFSSGNAKYQISICRLQ